MTTLPAFLLYSPIVFACFFGVVTLVYLGVSIYKRRKDIEWEAACNEASGRPQTDGDDAAEAEYNSDGVEGPGQLPQPQVKLPVRNPAAIPYPSPKQEEAISKAHAIACINMGDHIPFTDSERTTSMALHLLTEPCPICGRQEDHTHNVVELRAYTESEARLAFEIHVRNMDMSLLNDLLLEKLSLRIKAVITDRAGAAFMARVDSVYDRIKAQDEKDKLEDDAFHQKVVEAGAIADKVSESKANARTPFPSKKEMEAITAQQAIEHVAAFDQSHGPLSIVAALAGEQPATASAAGLIDEDPLPQFPDPGSATLEEPWITAVLEKIIDRKFTKDQEFWTKVERARKHFSMYSYDDIVAEIMIDLAAFTELDPDAASSFVVKLAKQVSPEVLGKMEPAPKEGYKTSPTSSLPDLTKEYGALSTKDLLLHSQAVLAAAQTHEARAELLAPGSQPLQAWHPGPGKEFIPVPVLKQKSKKSKRRRK